MENSFLKKLSSTGLSVFSSMKKNIKEIAEDIDKEHIDDDYDYDNERSNRSGRKYRHGKKTDAFLLPITNDENGYNNYGHEDDQDSVGPEYITEVIRRPPDFLAKRYNRDNPDEDYYYIMGFNSPMHIWLLGEIEYMERTQDEEYPEEEDVVELFSPITEANFEGDMEELRGFSPIDSGLNDNNNNSNNSNNNNNKENVRKSDPHCSYLKLNPDYDEDLIKEYNRHNFKLFVENFINVMLRKNLVNGIFCNKCEEVVDSILKGSKVTQYGFLDTPAPILLNPAVYIANTIVLEDLIKTNVVDKEYYEKRMRELVPELGDIGKEEK